MGTTNKTNVCYDKTVFEAFAGSYLFLTLSNPKTNLNT